MPAVNRIDPEHQKLATEFAQAHGVDGTIHDSDFIYWFDYGNAPENEKHQIALRYVHLGLATAQILSELIKQYPPPRQNFRILDFASGYGRVTRWLGPTLPDAEVHASDIHPDAVAFMQSIGLNAFLSHSDPSRFTAPGTFDVIWALSFFSHMPKRTFGRWLAALCNCLEPNGLLIFSAHGIPIWPLLGRPELDHEGFWFKADSEQKDLDFEEYGNTCSTPRYVLSQIEGLPLHVESLRSPGIGTHDIWIMRRVDPSILPPPSVSSWRRRMNSLTGRRG